MNLSVGYLGIVLLAVVCGTVLGNPMATTISNVDAPNVAEYDCVTGGGFCKDIRHPCQYGPLPGHSCRQPIGVHCCRTSPYPLPLEVDYERRGCVLNGAVYQNGDINRDLCMYMKCNNGAWEYTGQMNKDCGSCKVQGDSQFWTFDDTKFLKYGHKFELRGVGNFVISQNGMESPSFELNANLDACYPYPKYYGNQSCVQSITYRELGITVQLVLPPQFIVSGELIIPGPRGEIEVIVNGEVQKLTSDVKSAEAFSGTDGTVLIFENNHMEEEDNISCVNVVGSQGLSISLCQHEGDIARLYVLPMPTLKSNPSKLYGLCNTYTGARQDHLIARKGLEEIPTTNTTLFAESWRSSCAEVGGRCQGIHDICNGVIDRELGCSQQVCCIERKGCVLDNIPYEDGAFNDNTCMTMQCRNGAWEFTELIKEDCGSCTVGQDLYFKMFDNTTFLLSPGNTYRFKETGDTYRFKENGDYVITQNGLRSRPTFGLSATTQTCYNYYTTNLTCVTNISYYEPGITVEVALPSHPYPLCTRLSNPRDDPNCQFTVKIDDEEVQPTGRAMNIHSTFGSVLIFTHYSVGRRDNRLCMNIVGSRGLSVSLCLQSHDISWLSVLSMPNLKHKPSKLFGLCNTYTGQIQDHFTGRNVFTRPFTPLPTTNITTFGNSWKVKSEIPTQNISQEE